MAMIVPLIVYRLTEYLQQEMIDVIVDESKASIVKSWRFQDSPLDYPISLSVMGGDPSDPKYKDGRIDVSGMEVDLKIPAGEIGGGHLWWRRGRVKIGCYFVQGDTTQEDTADIAWRILGRASKCAEECPVADLVDEFGERAHWILITASSYSEGGGPENQYLWRGEIHWQALTERPV